MSLEPVFLSCAVTGGMSVPGQSEAIPVRPEEIVESAVEAHEAGAAILHIHVREPQTGKPIAVRRMCTSCSMEAELAPSTPSTN